MTRDGRRELLGFAVAIALVAGVPLLTRQAYLLSMGVFIGLNSLVALGLGLLLGYAGQVSLGHAAFYGLGAYGSAVLALKLGWNPWAAMAASAAGTGAVAYVVGRPTLRLHGHYLAMATLGFGIIVKLLFNEAAAITGGPSGLPGIPSLSLAGLPISDDRRMYCLIWPLVFLQVLLARNMLRSRVGRAMRAIHDSEVAARACGVDTGAVKVAILVWSAVWASLAGSLYAHTVTFVNPEPFGFAFSIELVVMVVLGGARSLWGPVIGAAVLTLVHQLLVQLGGLYAPIRDLDTVVFGVVMVVMLLFRPQGLAGLSWPRRRREAEAVDA